MRRMLFAVVCFSGAIVSADAQLGTTFWPQFLGGNLNTNAAGSGGTLPILKAQYFPNADCNGSFVIGVDGRIYTSIEDFSTDNYEIAAINPTTGATSYVAETPYGFDTTPTIDKAGNLLFSSFNSGLYSFNYSTGNQNWNNPGPQGGGCSPAISSDGTEFIADTNGAVWAINGSTGTTVWSETFSNESFYSTPTLDSSGNVYVLGGSGTLYALSHSSGATLWTYTAAAGSYGNTVSIGPSGNLYFADENGNVDAVNISTGSLLWTQPLGFGISASPAIDSKGNLYFTTYGNGVYALDGGSGNVLWNADAGDFYYAAPTIDSNGTLYALNESGTLTVFAGSSGNVLWSYGTGAGLIGFSPMVANDGTLYVPSDGYSDYAVTAFDTFKHATITLASSSLIGGTGTTGTITLPGTPFVDVVVALKSQVPAYVSVPSSVTIPAGSNSATFAVTTTPYTRTFTTNILATYDNASIYTPITDELEHVAGISLNPTSVQGGDTSQGTVTLAYPAPTTGYTVNLSSSNSSYVGVPSTLTIPAGSLSATFTATTLAHSRTYTSNVTASDSASKQSATLTVVSDAITSVSLNPTAVQGGYPTTVTVNLAGPAPASGYVVAITSSNPAYVGLPSSSVTILPGATSTTFQVVPKPHYPGYAANIIATDGLTKQSATLTVTGDLIVSVTLSPSTVIGGSLTTATVTLKNPAPSTGYTLNLTSGNPNFVGVPPTLLIASGQTKGSFMVTTKAYPASYSTTIVAADGLTRVGATLKVIPPPPPK